MNATFLRISRDGRALLVDHRDKLPYVAGLLLALIVYVFSVARDSSTHVYRTESNPDFKDARVLGFQGDAIYEGKERLLSKTMKEMMTAQAQIRETNEKLLVRIDQLEKGKPTAGSLGPDPVAPTGSASKTPNETQMAPVEASASGNGPSAILAKDPVHTTAPPEDLPITQGGDHQERAMPSQVGGGRSERRHRSSGLDSGTSIISFPVKDITPDRSEGVVLPAGSYVKAKLMTGVEAPEGKTYPVLLQLDYAYVVPNKHKLDLSGCFMIAKSQGDLSTERVQMQASKLSCVSKDGKMFEREVNGFIADDKDNSFAVIGSVNSKQDRVAAMAFLSSIVEGVGKAIQQAQTTQQTTPLGGSQSVLTGHSIDYMGAGGASNAAGLVTQWYLKQAQNLLPTINVGSGQDVWVVMQDTVKLPNDYFKKNSKVETGSGSYMYFSRFLE